MGEGKGAGGGVQVVADVATDEESRRAIRSTLADAPAVGLSGKWDIETHVYLTVKLTTFPNLHILPLGGLFINLRKREYKTFKPSISSGKFIVL